MSVKFDKTLGTVKPVVTVGGKYESKFVPNLNMSFFDDDLFSSILDSFCKVYHKMQKGGIIIVHDYEGADLPGVKKPVIIF
jgi:hypothetical protein